MQVFYRLCGIASTNPSPIYQEDKYKLNELCLKSFIRSFSGTDINPDIYFLLDFCGKEYHKMIDEIVPFNFKIEDTNLGIDGTAKRQFEIAKKIDDIILFQECDYVYQPASMKILEDGIKSLGLVSPYDHANFYLDRNLHSATCQIELINNYHFRSTERNTMTWGILPSIFRENYDTFYKYGYLDSNVWYDLKANNCQLWVPIPSIATHMAKDWLAPSVNWENIWKTYIEKN